MASRRSTTGCSSCKAKRKKCDETKPRCKRCVTSGSSCSYEFVEYPDHQSHRKRRTRPAPRAISELAARASRHDPVDLLAVNIDPLSVTSTSAVGFVHPILSATWGAGNFLDSNLAAPWDAVDPLSLSTSSSDPSLPVALDPILDPIDASQTSPNLDLQPTGVPAVWDVATVSSIGSPSRGLSWIGQEEEEENEDDSYDIEGVQVIICSSPCLDRNVQENSLPFVLHCYSQWTITRIFEPRAIADSVRDQVIEQFSAEHTRKKTILIANVMITFAKNLTIDSARMAILDYLVTEARQCGSRFMATPISVPALDRQNAMRTLDSIFEILTLQTHTQPTATCIRTLDYAAPVFRRACSEPPGKLINLPKLLMETSLNLRHFASVDVMQSVTTGRPMYFQYEVPFSLELCERMYRLQKDQGSQWLYGLPDQFIILIAWINYMSATSADSDTNPELVAWVEQQIPHIKVNTSESGDLLLRIGRMVVLECWRFAVFIYLYMVLGRADARDPRVVRAHKGFMRLVRGVKPGRIPDAFLVCPAIVAGVSAIEQKDRATLCKRILNVRECSEAGTAVSEVVLELEDVWTRTRDEGRAAVWSDLRTAVFRVTGR